MYQRPMSFQQIRAEIGCSFYSAKAAVTELGGVIRPKHAVLNNPFLGKNKSGNNSPTWKGGPAPCPICGGKKVGRKATICFGCYCKKRRAADSFEDRSKAWRGRSEYTEWRNAVFARDQYKCAICGVNDHDLHAHHLDGFTLNKDRRFDVENGVTLCQPHHKEFHGMFGYGGNTQEQFFQYKQDLRQAA